MYVEIHAESQQNGSDGKTTRVWAEESAITARPAIGGEAMLISASFTQDQSSGVRGGDRKPVTRTLQMNLTRADIRKLLAVAFNSGFLPKSDSQWRRQALALAELRDEVNAAVREVDALRAERARLLQVIDDARALLNATSSKLSDSAAP